MKVKGLQTSHNRITDIRHYLPKELSALYRSRASIAHFTINTSIFLLAKLSKTSQRESLMPRNKPTHDSPRMHLRSSSSPLSHFACLSVWASSGHLHGLKSSWKCSLHVLSDLFHLWIWYFHERCCWPSWPIQSFYRPSGFHYRWVKSCTRKSQYAWTHT